MPTVRAVQPRKAVGQDAAPQIAAEAALHPFGDPPAHGVGILRLGEEGLAIQLGHDYTGLIEPGMVADLVVIEGDPVADPSSLIRVRWVLKEDLTQFDLLRR